MDGVQLPQGYRATTRRQFTFYYKFPWNFWYSFDQLRCIKGWVDLGARQWFWNWDPWITFTTSVPFINIMFFFYFSCALVILVRHQNRHRLHLKLEFYSEHSQTSKKELFTKKINRFQSLSFNHFYKKLHFRCLTGFTMRFRNTLFHIACWNPITELLLILLLY